MAKKPGRLYFEKPGAKPSDKVQDPPISCLEGSTPASYSTAFQTAESISCADYKVELNKELCEDSKGACPLVTKSQHTVPDKGASPLATFPSNKHSKKRPKLK